MGFHFLNRQKHYADGLYSIIASTYYDYWNVAEWEYPIIDNTVFITYRVRDVDYRLDPMTMNFYRWTRRIVRAMENEVGCRKWVQQRQPVGMYAMDYDGSRAGFYVANREGAHVHSIMTLHPELKDMTISQLEMASKRYGSGFYWEPFDPEKTIAETIHYNLKGIMSERGFYPGRAELWDWICPRWHEPFVK